MKLGFNLHVIRDDGEATKVYTEYGVTPGSRAVLEAPGAEMILLDTPIYLLEDKLYQMEQATRSGGDFSLVLHDCANGLDRSKK